MRTVAVTREQVVVTVAVLLMLVGSLLLNLRVDRLWADFPERPGPCVAGQATACKYGFVN